MSLFDEQATVEKVVQYLATNPAGIASQTIDYWTGIDMSVHNTQPFFKAWVAFCAITQMGNGYYYYSADNPSYPKRTPVKFDYRKKEIVRMTVSMLVEADDTNEVSDYNSNGLMMANSSSSYGSYYSSSSKSHYPETPYFHSTNPRAYYPLRQIWDTARVLNYLAKINEDKSLPNNGGLNIRLSETNDVTKIRASVVVDIPMKAPLIPDYATTKNSSY